MLDFYGAHIHTTKLNNNLMALNHALLKDIPRIHQASFVHKIGAKTTSCSEFFCLHCLKERCYI
jgi:hypothetical protein